MLTHSWLFRILSVLAFAACRGHRSDQQTATVSSSSSTRSDSLPAQPGADSSLTLDRYFDLAGQIGESEQGIRGHLGPPSDRQVRPFQNIHTGTTDSILQLLYDGLEVQIYKAVDLNKELLIEILLTKPTGLNNLPITIGSSMTQVIAVFGDPKWTRDTLGAHVLDYKVGEVPQMLSFWTDSGVVRRIEWGFNID
jgi:hypothetical protein